ncbi:MAG: FKBP-type peptidyl-prolyl cis-trans isomerase [Cyclobacteriaceae bacterium]|nr:FKBP-type peptidyl-prolyl cis-trans isomerase [Cyclobacteriaceae bacterium]
MKSLSSLLLASCFLFLLWSCGSPKDRTSADLGDTITTVSGLRYVFYQKGEGRPVQVGSEVSVYLNMKVNNQQVWNTSNMPDSAFTFVAGKSALIKGFDEVLGYLREGDRIAAILPPSLAYGAQGSGTQIPPNATLVYDRFEVRKVSEPKASEADTLFVVLSRSGLDAMKRKHEQITTTADSLRFYHDKNQWRLLWVLLTDAGMHREALQIIDYFNKRNESSYRLFRVRSLDKMGEFKQAVDSLKALLESDTAYRSDKRVLKLLHDLEDKSPR